MAIIPDLGLMTVDEYHRLGEEGVLDEDARVELVDGRIVEMPPIGPRHLFNVNHLNQLFMLRLLGRIILSIQTCDLTRRDATRPKVFGGFCDGQEASADIRRLS